VSAATLDLREQARALYVPGVRGYVSVAKRLGVSTSTVRRWLNPEAADRDRAASRAYKAGRRGVCVDCGGETRYGGQKASGPDGCSIRCSACARVASRIWTAEKIIHAIQVWAAEHGRPPSAREWVRSIDGRFPSASCVYQHGAPFRSWADAIEAAGFPRPRPGHRYTRR